MTQCHSCESPNSSGVYRAAVSRCEAAVTSAAFTKTPSATRGEEGRGDNQASGEGTYLGTPRQALPTRAQAPRARHVTGLKSAPARRELAAE